MDIYFPLMRTRAMAGSLIFVLMLPVEMITNKAGLSKSIFYLRVMLSYLV